MIIEPPLKPKLIDFGISESDLKRHTDLQIRVDRTENYLLKGIAFVVSLIITLIFVIKFPEIPNKLPEFFQSQFGKITLYLITFLGAFGLQIFIFPPILIINTFLSVFILKAIYGKKQITSLEKNKWKIIKFNDKYREYNYKLEEFWRQYPDSKRFGENFSEYIEYKEKLKLENEKIRQEKLQQRKYWLEMSGYQFEKEIAKIYEKIGYQVIITKSSGDGGIDIILFDKIKNKFIIQCKNHRKPVGPSIIRELYGVMIAEKADKAILICSSGFTAGVYSFSKGKPIELLTLKDVIELNNKYCSQSLMQSFQ